MSRTGHHGYRRRRDRLLRTADVCYWCGGPLSPDAEFPDPMSTSADHVLPVKDGGHNLGALVAAHLSCNQARNRRQQAAAVRHAIDW